jgi:FkbM family methyltransferase
LRVLEKYFPWWLEKNLLNFPHLASLTELLLRRVEIRSVKRGLYLVKIKGIGEIFSWYDGIIYFLEIYRDNVYGYFKIRKGDVVIDIGANVGMFTVRAAKAVGERGLVIAVEPHPGNITLLYRNIKRLNLRNVLVLEKALGSNKRKAKLFLATPGTSSLVEKGEGRPFLWVEVDTLDNILSELGVKKVDLIKIDAEGSEVEILKGAQKTLNSKKVKLAIAAYHYLPNGKPELSEIMTLLKSKGFFCKTRNSYVYAKKV